MIKLDKLEVTLSGKTILEGISLEIGDDEKVAIIGRSGCGKTVLAKSIIGLFPISSGKITFTKSGQIIPNPRFAMLFQNSALLDSFTVYQNIALPLVEHSQLSGPEIRERILNVLGKLGLEHTIDNFPAELSGGMRKRIGLARAMINDPDFIIIDEPTSGLDPLTSNEIIDYIGMMINDVQVTALTITHDIKCINRLAKKILYIESGQVSFYGNVDDMQEASFGHIRQFFREFVSEQ